MGLLDGKGLLIATVKEKLVQIHGLLTRMKYYWGHTKYTGKMCLLDILMW